MPKISNWFPVATVLAAALAPIGAISQQAVLHTASPNNVFSAAVDSSSSDLSAAANSNTENAGISYSTSALPTTDQSVSSSSRGFFTRLGHAYLDDWTVDSNGHAAAPAPLRRGTPAPLNSPPFPGTDWPIGGTVIIGAPDTQTYPLMNALKKPNSRTKVYGWFDIGGNASTSNKGKYANGPVAYDVIPNSIQLDQAALYIERLPDTVQTDHFDYGFRFTSLYGLDYRYTTAKGVFSQQLLSYSSGQTYGFDEVMYYLDFYIPKIGKGTDVRVGRYISIPDIEAQLAPNNYTYSHSILYTFDCYTQQGINVTTKVNEHLKLQAGVSAGCDIAPWVTGAKLTGNVCVDYSWKNGGDRIYTCANSLNSAKYGYNNLSGYYLTYYHNFSPTWHTATEFLYQYQREVPNNDYAGPGPVTSPSPITGANGAHCNPMAMHCFAPDYGVVNYIEHEFNHHHSSFTIRNEFDNDVKGQRTGNATRYTSHLVGFNFWLGSTVTFRPELRFDHAYDKAAYDAPYLGSPTKKSQFTMAGDLIYHF